jgi:hypothetical protein
MVIHSVEWSQLNKARVVAILTHIPDARRL